MTLRQRSASFAAQNGTAIVIFLVVTIVFGIRAAVGIVVGVADGNGTLLVVSVVTFVLTATGAGLLLLARRDARRH